VTSGTSSAGRSSDGAAVLKRALESGTVAPGARITTESVRKSRLRELIAKEPLLERAVEELDLELLD
jgi:hypothetical protein